MRSLTPSPPVLDPDACPRLRPEAVLLTRPGGELQVGVDPAWRIDDPTGGWRSLLGRLDGRRTWRRLLAETPDPVALAHVLESLAREGLVDVGSKPAQPGTRHVRLVGSSPLAVAIGDRLLESGVDRLYVVDPVASSRTSPTRPAARAGTRRTRNRSGTPPSAGGRVRLSPHWTKPEQPAIPLTVVVADTLEVDRVIPADLLRHDLAHLLVRPQPAGAVVGPLVVPGLTSCLGCADLRRRDGDAAWPALLAQLVETPLPRLGPAVADWTVALTVTQVLSYLAGDRPESWGATLELRGYAMAWRPWRVHAECGCPWRS